jgi:hypothetical protein
MSIGQDASAAFPYEGTLYLVDAEGDIEPYSPRQGEKAEPETGRAAAGS